MKNVCLALFVFIDKFVYLLSCVLHTSQQCSLEKNILRYKYSIVSKQKLSIDLSDRLYLGYSLFCFNLDALEVSVPVYLTVQKRHQEVTKKRASA